MQVHAHVLILAKCQAHQHYFLFRFYKNVNVMPKMTELVIDLLRELADTQIATRMQLAVLHDLSVTGIEEDITTLPVELSSKVVEKPKYEEKTLELTTENPDVSCFVERSWEVEEAMVEQGTTVVKGSLRELGRKSLKPQLI